MADGLLCVREVLGVGDAALLASVSERTVRYWCASGRLPHLRVGRDHVILRGHLLRAMAERRPAGRLRGVSETRPRRPRRGREVPA